MPSAFDPAAAWDQAADAYAEGQASGRDYYRYEFFGPAQIALTGDVTGADLLDVGCGAGYFAREMAARGARVTGIDVAPRMIAHARAAGGDIAYEVLDAAAIAERFAPASFAVVTSCLALQDMPEPGRVLAAIRAVLRRDGRAVVSIEHPCTTMPVRVWERDATGKKLRLGVADYFARTTKTYEWTTWPQPFTTQAVHAPLEDWFAWIGAAGLRIHALREPRPTDDAVRARPKMVDATMVPYFLMLDLRPVG